MKVSQEDLRHLADYIRNAIAKEFGDKKLSKNIIDTIEIKANSPEKIQVVINAPNYNMYKFFMDGGVVVPTGKGSYASKLNDEGSAFMVYWGTKANVHRKLVEPRNHIRYVEHVIDEALNEWLISKSNKYKLKRKLEV